MAIAERALNEEPFEHPIAQEVDHFYRKKVRAELGLMKAIVKADKAEIYRSDGCDSIEEWVTNRLGMGFGKACELVRVALSLDQLPKMAKSFEQSRLSFDHLRALSQVTGPDNEADLLEAVEGLSVSDTFRIVRDILSVSREDSLIARGDAWVQVRLDPQSRQLFLYAVLPEDHGLKLLKAIDLVANDLPDDPEQHLPLGTRRAEALAELADSKLSKHGSNAQVVVHVDADDLISGSGHGSLEGGPLICAETVRRLSCDSIVQAIVEQDGVPQGMGRKQRTVTKAVKRELLRRDRHCRFGHCNRTVGLEAHHIVPWIENNETKVENLVLLCRFHHLQVEEGGYKVRGDPPKIWIERPGLPPIGCGPPGARQKLIRQLKFGHRPDL